MAKGRKRIPLKLQKLKGNPSKFTKKKLNESWELTVQINVPICPEDLDDIAKKEWQRITPQLIKLGLINEIDLAVLTGYVHSFSQFVQTAESIKNTGYLVKAPSGYPIVNPLLSINNESKRQMLKFAQELGLSVIQRAKISANKTSEGSDDFTNFLNEN